MAHLTDQRLADLASRAATQGEGIDDPHVRSCEQCFSIYAEFLTAEATHRWGPDNREADTWAAAVTAGHRPRRTRWWWATAIPPAAIVLWMLWPTPHLDLGPHSGHEWIRFGSLDESYLRSGPTLRGGGIWDQDRLAHEIHTRDRAFHSDPSVERGVALAESYLAAGQAQEALELLGHPVFEGLQDHRVDLVRSLWHLRVGEVAEATRKIGELLESNPDDEFARLNYALLLYDQGDRRQAYRELKRVSRGRSEAAQTAEHLLRIHERDADGES